MQVSVKLNIGDTSTRTISILFTAATWNSPKKRVQVSTLNESVDHRSTDSALWMFPRPTVAVQSPTALRLIYVSSPLLSPLLILWMRQFKRGLCAPPGAPDTIQVVFNKTPALLCTTSRFTTRKFSLNLRDAQIERPCLQGTGLIRGARTPGRSQSTQTDGGTDEDRETKTRRADWHFSLTCKLRQLHSFHSSKGNLPRCPFGYGRQRDLTCSWLIRVQWDFYVSADQVQGERCWTDTFSLPSRHIQKP